MRFRHLTSLGILVSIAQIASAANIPVTPKKLVVVDKLVAAGKAKVAFVVKDAAVTKGAGEDAEQIGVEVDLEYAGGSTAGAFVVPAGTANGWVVNKSTVAKYVNKSAPAGPTEAKVVVIKPAKLLKLVGKGLGDTDFDILAAGPPAGSVFTAFCVDNAGEENCHCSEFTGCVHKAIGGGTGAKLVCKSGGGDALCQAGATTTSTTTSTSSTTSTTLIFTDTGLTIEDSSTNLEWEKKTSLDGTMNPANLNDADNRYAWAGLCAIGGAMCQPDAASATICSTQTGGALGCAVCASGVCNASTHLFPGGSGLDTITTIWDWVSQLNAAAYGGHSDWRIATTTTTGTYGELGTIWDPTMGLCGGGSGPCIDPIFGATSTSWGYWSDTDNAAFPTDAIQLKFGTYSGAHPVVGTNKGNPGLIRAVRTLP